MLPNADQIATNRKGATDDRRIRLEGHEARERHRREAWGRRGEARWPEPNGGEHGRDNGGAAGKCVSDLSWNAAQGRCDGGEDRGTGTITQTRRQSGDET